ncbi:MAG: hypothetical protein QXK37_02185 [Candidatus Woesearchaeota archaeon]
MKKRALTSALLLFSLLSFLTYGAPCTNPCVNTARQSACFDATKDVCCPVFGLYGSQNSGLFGASCPIDKQACEANYWGTSLSSECIKGCCFSINDVSLSCRENAVEKIMCEKILFGTFSSTCPEIPDSNCEVGCCCHIDSNITFKGVCEESLYGTFYEGITTEDACDAHCAPYLNPEIPGSPAPGLPAEIEDWDIPTTQGSGIYLSLKQLCYDENRGDNRLIKEMNWFTGCNVPGENCPGKKKGKCGCQDSCSVSLTMPINLTDPREIRYEKTCGIAAKLVHKATYMGNNFNWVDGPKWTPHYSYVVDWDNNEAQCTLLGGDWLSDSEAASFGTTSAAFEGFRCCGDDWIYINNRALNYRSGISRIDLINLGSRGCLYNVSSVQWFDTNNDGFVDYYYCPKTTEHSGTGSYDPLLTLDDNPESDFATSQDPYYFVGFSVDIGAMPSAEVDVGKWQGRDATRLYCHHYFDNSVGGGDKFQWMRITDAADINQIICELHLGYNWTGSRCCGDDVSETYNDNTTECNARQLARNIIQTIEYSSRQFETEFTKQCDRYQVENSACYLGQQVKNKTAIAKNPEQPHVTNILAVNGTLYGCKDRQGNNVITDNSLISTGSKNFDKCTFLGDNVCAYYNDSWVRKSTDARSPAYVYLGYRGPPDQVVLSTLPPPGNPNSKECCFSGSCWNGEYCSPPGWVYRWVRQNQELVFKLFPETEWSSYNDEDVYTCYNSTWYKSKPKFNWYHDTSKLNFCRESFACMCSGVQTEPYDYMCSPEFVDNNDCLKVPNFYKGDHYCQAIYDGNEIVDSHWTSRTKLLAFQMIKIAENKDFVLFCDASYEAVNYPVPLSKIKDKINSVCTLLYDDTMVLGFTLNTLPKSQDETEIDSILYNVNNGLIDEILDEESSVPSCRDGKTGSGEQHGEFKRCFAASNKIWFNNKTKSLIYAKSGIDLSTQTLPIPDWNEFDSSLSEKVQVFKAHVQNNKARIEDGYYGKIGIDIINYVSDFNRLYINKKGTEEIIGFVETKFDNSFSMQLRNVMAVKYTGLDITCEEIKHAYPSSYCGVESGSIIVLDKGPENFELWRDLTSKIRLA